MSNQSISLSVLDLCPVPQGATPATALANARALAQHAESLGYHRYWVAEHHNMTGIASAATSVVMGYLAANTSSIRSGSGARAGYRPGHGPGPAPWPRRRLGLSADAG